MEKFSQSEIVDILHVKDELRQILNHKFVTLPVNVRWLVQNYGVVSGGASASLFHKEEPKDLDVYINNQHALDEFNKMLNLPEVLEHVCDVNEKYGGHELVAGKLVTSHAVTFKNGIQIITMHGADARNTFDYIHCMPYYGIETDQYFISHAQYKSIKEKVLVPNPHPKAFKPVDSRRMKFIQRGWKEYIPSATI